MSGTINLALSQQFDMDGEPLGGGLLYFFAAGTTTPQSAFQDQLLTILHPNPIVLDAAGRVPMFYLQDGNIKIRLTDDSGVTVIAADNLLVIGPSSGGGGGGGVDPTTVMAPGDIKARFGTGPLDGFVLCNGRTIGSATSSATERANADCQALFEYLWSTTVLGVFAGATPSRGASANGDWIANKQIALPDLRGRTIAGLDDMGATAAARLTVPFFGAPATTLGNAGGLQSISASALPPHQHLLQNFGVGAAAAMGSEVNGAGVAQDHSHGWGSIGAAGANGQIDGVTGRFITGYSSGSGFNMDHAHGFSAGISTQSDIAGPGGLSAASSPGSGTTAFNDASGYSIDHYHRMDIGGTSSGRSSGHIHALSGNTQLQGSGAPGGGGAASLVQPAMVLTFYIKL